MGCKDDLPNIQPHDRRQGACGMTIYDVQECFMGRKVPILWT